MKIKEGFLLRNVAGNHVVVPIGRPHWILME